MANPTTITRESLGSLTLHICNFSESFANATTWYSGLSGVVGYFANITSGAGAAGGTGGINVAYESPVFTFTNAGNGPMNALLYVLSKS